MAAVTDIIRLQQFSFSGTQDEISDVLARIAHYGVNVRAIMQYRHKSNLHVHLIPGVTTKSQSDADLYYTVKAIKKTGLSYEIDTVLAVLLPDVPGQLAFVERRLSCNVKIYANYRDRSLRNVYQVSDIDLAEEALRYEQLKKR